MKVLFKMVLILGITAALSGFLLAYVNQATHFQIKENEKKTISSAIYKLIPESKKYVMKTISGYKVFYVYAKNGNPVAYCILTSGNGYQGEIKILIAVDLNLEKLRGIEILQKTETPGLGGKIGQDSFLKQFQELKFLPQINYVKNRLPEADNEIQAITGATVSSSSVVRILNNTLPKVIPELKLERNG